MNTGKIRTYWERIDNAVEITWRDPSLPKMSLKELSYYKEKSEEKIYTSLIESHLDTPKKDIPDVYYLKII